MRICVAVADFAEICEQCDVPAGAPEIQKTLKFNATLIPPFFTCTYFTVLLQKLFCV